MTPQQLISEHRAAVRRLYDDLVKLKGTAALLAVTPTNELDDYFAVYDAASSDYVPREGLDLTREEFADAMEAMGKLLTDADAAMPQLRKLL